MKIRGKHLLVLLSVCGMIASGVGLLTNTAGLFFTPAAQELHLERGTVALTLTVSNLLYAFGGVMVNRVITERNFRFCAVVFTGMLAGATVLMGSADNIVVLCLASAVRGFAGGMLGFVLATMILNAWFEKNNGLATSIAMSTSGIAGALFSPLISSLITQYGWRMGYVFTGLLMVVMNLPVIFLLPSLRPQTEKTQSCIEEQRVIMNDEQPLKINRTLFVMVFLFAFLGCAVTALPQHFPAIALSYGMNEVAGALMLSACMLANTFGKIIMGFLSDHIGSEKSILLYAFGMMAGLILLLVVRNMAALLISAVLIGLSYSLGTVGTVMLIKDTFSSEGYTRTYPVISLGGTIGNALYSSAIGFLCDVSGSYVLPLILSLCFGSVVVISTVFCRWKRDEGMIVETI